MARKHNRRANKRSQSIDVKKYAHALEAVFRKYPTRKFNYKQLAAQLGYKPAMVKAKIEMALSDMERGGKIIMVDRGRYKLKYNAIYTEGVVDMASNGNAYVVSPDTERDILIRSANLNKALNGDKVRVSLFARRGGKKLEGEIVEIVERKTTDFVGTVEMGKNFGFLVPSSRKMLVDIFIPKEKLNGVEHGQKAIARIVDWPEKASSPFGEIIKVLGNAGEHNTEIHAVLAEFGLPYEFPEEVEQEANTLDTSIKEEEIVQNRRDFRAVPTFTIDPADAKDFDDALSLQQLENGNWEVGVHIADVSHYLTPGSILDEEAVERATSVYLVDRVVPMLPEILSNGACSLRPQEEKYTFSSVFTVNDNMEIEKEWFGKSVILSDHRFSYEEVQFVLDSGDRIVSEEVSLTDKEYSITEDIFTALCKLDYFAKILRKKRMSNGALSFDRVEVKFNLDHENNPESIFFKSSKDAHKLVEEFMLLANRRVAEFVGKQKPTKPFVYRIHDLPDEDKLGNLKTIANNLGYQLNLDTKQVNTSLNKLLQETHGQKEQELIDTLTIRCMSKAVYTVDNIGHYGLAFDHYTHFTSPIRRYPDVMVHRLLEFYLKGEEYRNAVALEEACTHASNREQLATKAERDSIKYMQVKFMEDKLGQHFEGVISGVTDRGIYVEIIENKCEGMVKISEIKGDYFVYDEKTHSLVGERTKTAYQLGDPVGVIVKKADLMKRQLDFILGDQIE